MVLANSEKHIGIINTNQKYYLDNLEFNPITVPIIYWLNGLRTIIL